MSLRAIGRMILAPGIVAVAVGLMLRRLGDGAAVILAIAAFFAAQLLVSVQSKRQLSDARQRLEMRKRNRGH